jgi:hypothetical protein
MSYNQSACDQYGTDTAYSVEKEECVRAYIQWKMDRYQETREAQYEEYSATREAQFLEYRDDSLEQVDEYKENTEGQAEEYKEDVEAQTNAFVEQETEKYEDYSEDAFQQFEDFAEEMREYGDVRGEWETNRQKAIGAAEAILSMIYEDYGRAFKDSAPLRWLYIAAIAFGEFILILIAQKRKDSV